VGVEPEKKPPHDDLLGVRNRVIVGVAFAIFYILTFGPRTGWLAGVVSGLLGGAVVYLLLKEIDERRKRRRR
jgi:ABC-type Fe3+-siderophore transport system permease subunit